MLPHWTVITYLLYTSRYTCRQNVATLSLPICCAHQDKHESCCQNVATLDNHYLLVVHIKIHKIHAVKMLPHQSVITYLLCTLRYACCQNAATSDSHYLLVVHNRIHKLSKCCHTGQSLPTCCAHEHTHAVKRLPHWTVITYLLCTSGYTCCQNAATLDSHYLPVVHIKIRMLSKCCHIRQSLPTCCTH